MKQIVKTTGSFQLVDPQNHQLIPHDRPAVVAKTSFTIDRIVLGQLEVLADLPDEATDVDFADALKESNGDVDLAVAAYKSELEPKPATKVKPLTKPANKE